MITILGKKLLIHEDDIDCTKTHDINNINETKANKRMSIEIQSNIDVIENLSFRKSIEVKKDSLSLNHLGIEKTEFNRVSSSTNLIPYNNIEIEEHKQDFNKLNQNDEIYLGFNKVEIEQNVND